MHTLPSTAPPSLRSAPIGVFGIATSHPERSMHEHRRLDTTDGLVSVTAVAWGILRRHQA